MQVGRRPGEIQATSYPDADQKKMHRRPPNRQLGSPNTSPAMWALSLSDDDGSEPFLCPPPPLHSCKAKNVQKKHEVVPSRRPNKKQQQQRLSVLPLRRENLHIFIRLQQQQRKMMI